jgi:hypothetical protein
MFAAGERARARAGERQLRAARREPTPESGPVRYSSFFHFTRSSTFESTYATDLSNTFSLCHRRSSGSGRSTTCLGRAISRPSIA